VKIVRDKLVRHRRLTLPQLTPVRQGIEVSNEADSP
jgi:hypothetical protein